MRWALPLPITPNMWSTCRDRVWATCAESVVTQVLRGLSAGARGSPERTGVGQCGSALRQQATGEDIRQLSFRRQLQDRYDVMVRPHHVLLAVSLQPTFVDDIGVTPLVRLGCEHL